MFFIPCARDGYHFSFSCYTYLLSLPPYIRKVSKSTCSAKKQNKNRSPHFTVIMIAKNKLDDASDRNMTKNTNKDMRGKKIERIETEGEKKSWKSPANYIFPTNHGIKNK